MHRLGRKGLRLSRIGLRSASAGRKVVTSRANLPSPLLPLEFETGRIATLADGSVLLRSGKAAVLCTVVSKPPKEPLDFLPLSVEFQEKAFAYGEIPGTIRRTEGPPSLREILTGRMIDRSLRPLFPKGFANETQIVATLLSADPDAPPADILALNAASAALALSPVPWNGPVGAVKLRLDESGELASATGGAPPNGLELTVAGTADRVTMIECASHPLAEGEVERALEIARDSLTGSIEAQSSLAQEAGRAKWDAPAPAPAWIAERADAVARARFEAVFDRVIPGRTEREEALWAVRRAAAEEMEAELLGPESTGLPEGCELEEEELRVYIGAAVQQVESRLLREMAVLHSRRIDGRGAHEIRPLGAAVDLLPGAHGSALFDRGDTQVLCAAVGGATHLRNPPRRFGGPHPEIPLHMTYEFPPYSTGETGRVGGFGNRREIGHGALSEKALRFSMPARARAGAAQEEGTAAGAGDGGGEKEEYMFSYRVTSIVTGSNGSSSMASVCGASMALMDMGVNLKHGPVAGISIGLLTVPGEEGAAAGAAAGEGEGAGLILPAGRGDSGSLRYVLLTDIMGLEDYLGDMDFKVAGTAGGLTAIQFDTKLAGLPYPLVAEALGRARVGRLRVLETMAEAIEEPRAVPKPHAPLVEEIKINPGDRRLVIGPGGETIRHIQDQTGCTLDVNDDVVQVFSHRGQGPLAQCKKLMSDHVGLVSEGQDYQARVLRLASFGAFVQILPSKSEGMVHISELADKFVKDPSEVVRVGDQIVVRCTGHEPSGRPRFSRRAAAAPSSSSS